LYKNPESLIKFCAIQVGQISHFILWSNAQYNAVCKSYGRSQYYYAPTTILLHKMFHGKFGVNNRSKCDFSKFTISELTSSQNVLTTK